MKFYKFVDHVDDYLYHKIPLLGRILSYFIEYAVSSPNVLMSSLIVYFQLLLDLSVPNTFCLENHDAEKE
jgi:hypothetical protein